MPLTPIGKALSDKYSSLSNLQKQVNISKLLEISALTIKKILGEKSGNLAKPLYLKNKTLTISCVNSGVAQEIRLNQNAIIVGINQSFGDVMVERLRYLL